MSGTSRTEPGPRPARGRVWAPHLAMTLVLAGVALAVGLTVADGYVTGGLVLSAVCALAAMARLLLPTSWVGTLAVRRSGVDAVVLASMAAAVAVLTLSVPTP